MAAKRTLCILSLRESALAVAQARRNYIIARYGRNRRKDDMSDETTSLLDSE